MQLGGRFSVGQAPASLPQPLRDEIAAIEATLSSEETTTLRWTLTWLEGRPVVELDDGRVLRG
ncbi:MAG: hypothetical protein K9G09_05375 [Pontimonas sp.]|nr:hypothetical protein [Pontimonas sp.]